MGLKFKPTDFRDDSGKLAYAKLSRECWRVFIDRGRDRVSGTGEPYASEKELLADLAQLAATLGFKNKGGNL